MDSRHPPAFFVTRWRRRGICNEADDRFGRHPAARPPHRGVPQCAKRSCLRDHSQAAGRGRPPRKVAPWKPSTERGGMKYEATIHFELKDETVDLTHLLAGRK